MFDVVIKGGTVVDGTGAAPFGADVAVRDGIIAEVGTVTGQARRVINADGALVTPGWVDIHTHYDGQVTWDEVMEPSASNGVTTLVMGNCGVGFAPVRPGQSADLIDLMEGVEDIPGTALSTGMPWGEWETFPQYLDVLATRRYGLDIAAQIPHGSVRFYVMGERGAANENATAEDLVAMARIVGEAMDAGAVGFSTSRIPGHKSRSGRAVPGTYAEADELMAIASEMRTAGHGVFEAIVGGTLGSVANDTVNQMDEIPLLTDVSRTSGRPVTFTLVQLFEYPNRWREVLDAAGAANEEPGVRLRPQVIPRSVTIMTSLDTYHMFSSRPTYRKIAGLTRAERVAEMRKHEVRAAILAEDDIDDGPTDANGALVRALGMALPLVFALTDPVEYEPDMNQSIFALATAAGVDPVEFMYDRLLDDDGQAFYALLGSNFAGGNLEVCREMILSPHTVTGLGDAGAHVNLISDCSASTFHLTHWGRDRTKGERLPIEVLVHKLSGSNAALYGFNDRGVIAPGRRADLNVIDIDRLKIKTPELRYDLPAGASRILQGAEGYLATLVAGEVTRKDDADTGARPGRLTRGSAQKDG